MGYLSDLEADVMAEWRRKSRNVLYQTDPQAWLYDVAGRRWWSKQRDIAHSFVTNEFTVVKSANGVGKTMLAADLVGWFASVFPAEETSVLVSAPVRAQIDEMMFRYLRELYSISAANENRLRGEITKQPKWITEDPYRIDLVVPKRPADSNLLSSFQGIHNTHVAVVLDEAGGLQEDFYMGANAVTTNDHARVLAIGNPDRRNTAFHKRFTDREAFVDWNTFTIGVDDTPNFTGEMIYPEDPEKDAAVKLKLVKVKWAEMMRRSASIGVIAAKVDGEFPGESDNSFFSQMVIDRAGNTFALMSEIEAAVDDPPYRWLGVDVAFAGEDKNVVYLNVGGKITKVDEWDKGGEDGEEAVEDANIARRIHKLAALHAVTEVRVDAAGSSRGVHSNLKTLDEFKNREYVLIGIVGNNASPDNRKWLNFRAWAYDDFRKNMSDGKIGIDPLDQDLRTDLEVLTFKYTVRSQLQISSKKEIKADLKHSPDHLDAALYASIDFSPVIDGPGAGHEPGDIVSEDPWEMAEMDGLAGLPI